MKQDQEPKLHVCRYCTQSFSNGKQLGGHMRSHLALIAASRKKGVHGINQFVYNDHDDDHVIKKHGVHGFGYGGAKMVNKSQLFDQDYDQDFVNGEKGPGFAYDYDKMVQKSQHFDQGYDHDYGANGRIKGEDFVNGEKGLGFAYGYDKMVQKSQHFDQDYDQGYGEFDDGGGYEMVKKSQLKMEVDQDYDQDDGADNVYGLRENPKRSWRVSSSNSVKDFGIFCQECGKEFSSSKALVSHKRSHSRKESNKDTVCEKCGRGFDSLKALYGHMRCHSAKRSQISDALDEHEHVGGGVANPMRSGQLKTNRVGSAMLKCKSTKIPRSCDQDFGDRDGTDSGIFLEPKRRYKDHVCAICYKKFGSAQALGSHKRIHNKAENKSLGVNSSDVEFKLTWVHSEIEWDPFAVVN